MLFQTTPTLFLLYLFLHSFELARGITCSDGEYLNAAKDACYSCGTLFPGCTSCATDPITTTGYCIACESGKFVTFSKQSCSDCSTLIPNCASCSLDPNGVSQCTECTGSGEYVLNYAKTSCQLCTDVWPNCAICGIGQTTKEIICLQCSYPYFVKLDYQGCGNCQDVISDCTECNVGYTGTAVTICLDCATTTNFLNNSRTACGDCNSTIYDCTVCNKTSANITDCLECGNNKFVTLNKDECTQCDYVIADCGSCESNSLTGETTCNSCMSSEHFVSLNKKYCSTCEKIINGCTKCDKNDDGTPNCTQCQDNKFPSTDKSQCLSCVELINDCKGCSFDTDNTTVICSDGCGTPTNILDSTKTKCFSCTSPEFRKFDKSGCDTCSAIIPDCTECQDNTDFVTVCKDCSTETNFLSENRTICSSCSELIPDCVSCAKDPVNNTGYCTSCTNSKFPGETKKFCLTCSEIIPYCSQCASDSDGFTTCTGGCTEATMFLSFDKISCDNCTNLLPDCKTCGSDTNDHVVYCKECAVEGLVPNASRNGCIECAARFEGCLQCSVSDTGEASCTDCGTDHFFNGTHCLETVISNCVSLNSDETCAKCQTGYGMKNGDNTKCLACVIPDCEVCVLDASNNPSCSECATGFAWTSDQCSACSDLLTDCATCNYSNNSATCLSCNTSTRFLRNGACINCSVITGSPAGINHCSECNLNENVVSCEGCFNEYYLESGVCNACPNGCAACSDNITCSQCTSGYFFNSSANNCLLCNKENCANCSSDIDLCDQCNDGYFWNITDCTACVLNNCGKCSSGTACTECEAGYLLDSNDSCETSCISQCDQCIDQQYCVTCSSESYTSVSLAGNTCITKCATDGTEITVSLNKSCVACDILFAYCSTCNARVCLSCSSSQYIFLNYDGKKCSECAGENDVPYNETKICSSQSNTTIKSVQVNNFIPLVSIECVVESAIYFAYGLYNSTDNFTLKNIQDKAGMDIASNVFLPANETNYWVGYGLIANADTSKEFNITNILKNSNETYNLLAFCVSLNGKLESNGSQSWVQPSNGGKTVILYIEVDKDLTSTEKQNLGAAIKSVLKIDRDVYIDDGDLVTQTTARELQTNADNSTNNTDNTQNNSNVSFYIIPDYTLTSDPLVSQVNQSLENSNFITNLTKLLGDVAFTVVNASVVRISDPEPSPILTTTEPKFNISSNKISFSIGIENTNGFIYFGVGKKLNSTTNNETNNTDSNNTNLTAPTWTQFRNSKDVNNEDFVNNFTYFLVSKGVSKDFELKELEPGAEYNVYFAASNEIFPRIYSDIYTSAVKTTDNTNTTSFICIIHVSFWLLFALILVVTLI